MAVPGSQTGFYDLVHEQDWWIKGGQLWSSRSVNAFARGNMTLMRPESIVLDTWRWELGDDGVLRPTDQGCAESSTVDGTRSRPPPTERPGTCLSRLKPIDGVMKYVRSVWS